MRRRPKPLQPKAIQASYFAELRGYVRALRALVRARLVSRLPEYVKRLDHMDAAQQPGKRVNTIVDGISRTFYRQLTPEKMEKAAMKYATRASEHNRQQLQKQIGITLPSIADRGLSKTLAMHVHENVSLIKSLADDQLGKVEKLVLSGMRNGLRADELGGLIDDQFDVGESRALLIARDQIGKLTGDLNELRMTNLGINQYIWRTMNDNRVRPEHEDLEGELCSWDDPPEDGHPGEAINCRCYPEPVLDDNQ